MLSHQRKAIFAKPCPFCGSRNVITETRGHFYGGGFVRHATYIRCEDCGAEVSGDMIWKGNGYDGSYNSAQHAALTAWNRRSA